MTAQQRTAGKHRPGRPRTAPAPQGFGRTALASRFNVPVKTVDKWLREGCPCTRSNGRVFFDLAAVATWRDEFASRPKQIPDAAQLHPDDPRHRERTAAAKVKLYKLALDSGEMVSMEMVASQCGDALTKLNAALNAVPAMAFDLDALTRENAHTVLAPVIEDALSEFAPDNPAHWPDPAFVTSAEDDDADEFEERAYQPILPANDPRAQIALVQAQRHEAELAQLESNSITVEDVRRLLHGKCEAVRKRMREIPKRVAKRLKESDNDAHVVLDALRDEIDGAKIACGGEPAGA